MRQSLLTIRASIAPCPPISILTGMVTVLEETSCMMACRARRQVDLSLASRSVPRHSIPSKARLCKGCQTYLASATAIIIRAEADKSMPRIAAKRATVMTNRLIYRQIP